MTVTRANVEFAKRILADRVGNQYQYGGNWDPFQVKVGTDCSGLVVDELDAAVNGTKMAWTRHGLSTESWRPIEVGQVGPFGTICVRSPADFPPDAAVKIAIHHGPGGGANSHTWCEVDGVRGESNGTDGCVTGSRARSVYDTSYANDWHYLPGPIVEDGTPATEEPVTLLGLDYAGGRPGGGAIKNAGYAFVVRYLSSGGSGLPGKQLLPAEANDLRANGIEIVSNWETTATRMLAGFNGGVADATSALAQVLACGGRADRPIYFSADWDATEAQQTPINDYLRGAATVIGVQNVGIYGGFWPVSRALNAGVAKWAWQTKAWSGTNVDPRINLWQRIGFVNVGGVQCDVNESRTSDYGQWSGTTPTGGISMADAQSIINQAAGIDANGAPLAWRKVKARANRDIGDIVNDPNRGPWESDHNGTHYDGTFDADEQLVTVAEQIAWTHKFSDGVERDSGDVLIALGEFLVKQGAFKS
jgi:hypothetical protein